MNKSANVVLEKMASNLTGKIDARDQLVGRLAKAEAAVVAATLAATQLAVSGADDTALDAAEAKVRALSDRVTTLRSAIVEAEAIVVTH